MIVREKTTDPTGIVSEANVAPVSTEGVTKTLSSRRDQWIKWMHEQKAYAARFEDRLKRGRMALVTLRRMITENEARFFASLEADLGKSKIEAYASEIAVTLNEIDFLLAKQRHFLKDRKIFIRPGSIVRVSRRPYGSVLVMSPWNYPFQLALLPVAGALVTGNGCFLKPSELAPATSGLIAELAVKYFNPEVLVVVEGDGDTAAALLENDWDFLFFTGSERVGSIVAERAAKLRIPSVLELGGKCPCIVDAASVSEITARRIVWGKFFNAGQTCVAPDYVLVEESAREKLLAELKKQIVALYGENPLLSKDYGHIIGSKQFARLEAMIQDGKVFHGGTCVKEKLYIEPTILTDPQAGSTLMQEEIFGPLLPVLTWSDQKVLFAELSVRPEPLAMYAFCKDKNLIDSLEKNFRSGAFSLNHVLEHVALLELPFGGVGNSGYGRYHGEATFEAFTWSKTIYKTKQNFDVRLKYPPYQDKHLKWIRRIRKWLP